LVSVPTDIAYWWLKANPKIWDLRTAPVASIQAYTAHNEAGNKRQKFKHFAAVKPGDLLIGYVASPDKEIRALIDERNIDIQISKPAFFTNADALSGLFMSPAELDIVLARLKRKKALILQGPPGVGKTFVARRLAFAAMGEKDNRRVTMIQFHPSYGYEDFVQGYRPAHDGLERRDGVLYQLVRQARNDANRDWFFIIDEINRGNLAKIFGEILMLIEADKRGSDHAVPLTYSDRPDETFYLPENLYFIGTARYDIRAPGWLQAPVLLALMVDPCCTLAVVLLLRIKRESSAFAVVGPEFPAREPFLEIGNWDRGLGHAGNRERKQEQKDADHLI
jgi:hypothetical protein